MVPMENGGEREDSPNNIIKDETEGKDAECDYEQARHSVSSSQGGETPMIDDNKVKKTSRVSQKFSRKQAVENLSRPTKSTSGRQESTKLQFKVPNNNRKKSEKPNKGVATRTKNLSDQKAENPKVSTRSSSESFEGADEKVVECKPIEEVKEIEILDETPNCDQSVGTDETIDAEDISLNEIKKMHNQKIVEMGLRIDKLEEELREVAALEISLYSVVAEHGTSSHKVHTPARRLSRLYNNACKNGTQDKRATVARNTVSGLVSIAKSCGSDVPRLTFWLSNIVVLREIITGAFGNNISHSSIMNKVGESNDIANKNDAKSFSMKWNTNYGSKSSKKYGLFQFAHDWQETDTYTDALEKIESWIFSRIVDSVWWQTLTPHMQSPADDLYERKDHGKLMEPALGDQKQGIFSIELWKNTFRDAFSLLCPVRAEGHECGCLPVLARMVMEQCVSRLDVAMFNAILRESANEIPTDPVSDPIVDPKVLPIPAGDLSFGSGAQLKKSIGNWSRWLTDLLGMDIDDTIEYGPADQDDTGRWGGDNETKCFCLLHSLSELLMLPKDMLLDRSIRKEVCPLIDPPLLTRILCNFTPDEFCPDLVPGVVLEELNSEGLLDKDLSTSFPFSASSIIYCLPSVAEVAQKVADTGGKAVIGRNASIIQSKGYSSDEELDNLDSPFTSILNNSNEISITNARFELLREVWSP